MTTDVLIFQFPQFTQFDNFLTFIEIKAAGTEKKMEGIEKMNVKKQKLRKRKKSKKKSKKKKSFSFTLPKLKKTKKFIAKKTSLEIKNNEQKQKIIFSSDSEDDDTSSIDSLTNQFPPLLIEQEKCFSFEDKVQNLQKLQIRSEQRQKMKIHRKNLKKIQKSKSASYSKAWESKKTKIDQSHKQIILRRKKSKLKLIKMKNFPPEKEICIIDSSYRNQFLLKQFEQTKFFQNSMTLNF
jgi:hypothetical protein